MSKSIELFDYQKKVIEYVENDLTHSQLISMPTGTGKTITFLSLAKKINKKTLIIVHREELLIQTYDKAKLCGYEENEISIINADKKDKLNKLNIAMVQSLNKNLDRYFKDDIELIIVDEAHHALAPSYRNIFTHFKVFEEKKLIFGFTATPLRGDKEQLSEIFFSHSFKMTLSEATQMGYIVPVHGLRIEMQKSLKEIDSKQGDYDITQLENIMNCDSINSLIVERCKFLKKTPSIVFCTSVNHSIEIAKRLRAEKRKAISISYKTPKSTLKRIFKMLSENRIEFITNAVKLSEGFDHPPIQSIIIARPTRSPVLYKQMIGRGLRNFENKEDCFVLEFTSNDPKMMKWEDIDENSTFQSSNEKDKICIKEAKNKYITIFRKSDVEILDIRISPFKFYECKLRRLVKYGNFYFLPFEEGFVFFEISLSKNKIDRDFGGYYNLFGTTLFWVDKYKTFYVWQQPNFHMNRRHGTFPIKVMVEMMKHYAECNKMGKWYPSEQEPVTRRQKKIMQSFQIKYEKISSARKAEMEIENICIKNIIDKFLCKHQFSGIMSL